MTMLINIIIIRQQQATLTKAERDIFLKGNTEFFNLGLIQERPVSERYFVNGLILSGQNM